MSIFLESVFCHAILDKTTNATNTKAAQLKRAQKVKNVGML